MTSTPNQQNGVVIMNDLKQRRGSIRSNSGGVVSSTDDYFCAPARVVHRWPGTLQEIGKLCIWQIDLHCVDVLNGSKLIVSIVRLLSERTSQCKRSLRWVPSFNEQLPTGLEHVASKLPVTQEEYHNRMVKEWVHGNKQRRVQAQNKCEILGIEHQSPVMPSVPVQMGTDFMKRER
eukprot:763094-Amphidinium_carterae.1